MSEGEEKSPLFKRRPIRGDDSSIARRAAQELEDLNSDHQWSGAQAPANASADRGPEGARRAPASADANEPLARVQAMVERSLRDDFLVATRRAGTSAQQAIAAFVQDYVKQRAGRQ